MEKIPSKNVRKIWNRIFRRFYISLSNDPPLRFSIPKSHETFVISTTSSVRQFGPLIESLCVAQALPRKTNSFARYISQPRASSITWDWPYSLWTPFIYRRISQREATEGKEYVREFWNVSRRDWNKEGKKKNKDKDKRKRRHAL